MDSIHLAIDCFRLLSVRFRQVLLLYPLQRECRLHFYRPQLQNEADRLRRLVSAWRLLSQDYLLSVRRATKLSLIITVSIGCCCLNTVPATKNRFSVISPRSWNAIFLTASAGRWCTELDNLRTVHLLNIL